MGKEDRVPCDECGEVIEKGTPIDDKYLCSECQKPAQLADAVEIFTHAELMKREFEPPEWIIDGILGVGHLGILTGFSGHGKSWIALSLAIDAASGGMFLGKYQLGVMPVLYIENENGIYELRRRCEYLTRDKKKLNGLHFAPYPSLDLLESTEWLETQIQNKQISLIVLDSFAGLHAGKENEAEEMRKVLTRLKKIAMEYEVTFVLLLHPNKGAGNFKKSKNSFPPDYLERIRGSSEFRNVADDIIGVWMPDAEEKSFFFEPVKCRTGAIQEGEVFRMVFDDTAQTLDFEFVEKKKDYKLGAEKCLNDIVIWATNERKDDGKFKTKDAKEAMEGKWANTIVNDALKIVREGKCDQIEYLAHGKYGLKDFVRKVREVRTDNLNNFTSEEPSDEEGVGVGVNRDTNTPLLGSSEKIVRKVRQYIIADNFADKQVFDASSVAIALKLAENDVLASLQTLSKDGIVREVSPGLWRRGE